jgi:integrase
VHSRHRMRSHSPTESVVGRDQLRLESDCEGQIHGVVTASNMEHVHMPARVADFAYYSGWRRGEIIGLTWREIDMAGTVIRPERSKTRTGRLLPMSQPLKEVLQRRVAARRLDSLMVFHRDGDEMIDWRKA